MTFRRHIAVFMLITMLATQLALAQHYGAHFHEGTTAHKHQKNDVPPDDEKTATDAACQICDFAKSFSQTLDSAGITLPLVPALNNGTAFRAPAPFRTAVFTAVLARGPPVAVA